MGFLFGASLFSIQKLNCCHLWTNISAIHWKVGSSFFEFAFEVHLPYMV